MLKSSGFITLTTDFGLADGFVGTMKGVIYNINPDSTVIDISHGIESQDTFAAAFLFGSSYGYFPPGTVHTVVVDPGVGSQRRAVAVETDRYFFVAPDNGVLTRALAREKVVKSVELTNRAYFLDEVSNTFHGRDIFAPVAAHLSLGIGIETLGVEIDDLEKLILSEPEVGRNSIEGQIVHIDKFGNLISDIPRTLFDRVVPKRSFVIKLKGVELDRIRVSYTDVPVGGPLAVFGSFGNLEIALNHASAADFLDVSKGEHIRIIF